MVHSTAVKEDNPELAAARARGLKVLRRGELLAELMKNHTQVAVTGMHGKTSTTAMTAAVLRAGNLDPTVVVGSVWDGVGSNAVLGRGDYFVAESDESDGSFALLSPEITIITNLDREHLDYYRDLAHVQEMFAAYLQRLPKGARVIACADDPNLAPVLADCPHELITYSLKPGGADFYATDLTPLGLGYRFRLWRRGAGLGDRHPAPGGVPLRPQRHGRLRRGEPPGPGVPGLAAGAENLGQIHRRCQLKGEARGILVMDDYGHHPTEIRSTLTGLAQAFPDRRLVVAFQPHRYSRTRALLPEFFPVFDQAQMVFITEIYGAGEPRPDGLSGRSVYEGVCGAGHPGVHFIEENAAQGRLYPRPPQRRRPGPHPGGRGYLEDRRRAAGPPAKPGGAPGSEARMKKKTRAAAFPPRPPAAGAQDPAHRPRSRRKRPGSSPGGAPKTVTAATVSRESPGKPGSGALAWLFGLLTLAGLCLGLVVLYHQLLTSPLFCIKDIDNIEIEGARRLSRSLLLQQSKLVPGASLLAIRPGQVERALMTHPWIAKAEVSRKWPHSLHLTIQERDPVALVQFGEELLYMDRQGMIFKPLSPGDPHNFPVITGLTPEQFQHPAGDLPEVVAQAFQLMDVLKATPPPLNLENISEIHVDLERGFTLYANGVAGRSGSRFPGLFGKIAKICPILARLSAKGATGQS